MRFHFDIRRITAVALVAVLLLTAAAVLCSDPMHPSMQWGAVHDSGMEHTVFGALTFALLSAVVVAFTILTTAGAISSPSQPRGHRRASFVYAVALPGPPDPRYGRIRV